MSSVSVQPFSVSNGGFAGLPDADVMTLRYAPEGQPHRARSASVAIPYGANLVSMRVGGHELIYTNVPRLKANDFTGSFPMFPYPGRYRDKAAQLPSGRQSLRDITRPGGEPFIVNGLVYDRPWTVSEAKATNRSATLAVHVDFKPGTTQHRYFPAPCRLSIQYQLTASGLTMEHTVTNLSDQPLAYGFGWRPSFKRIGADRATTVTVPAASVVDVDADRLPTGRLHDVGESVGGRFDLRSGVPLAEIADLDHSFTDLRRNQPASINYESIGVRIDLHSSREYAHAVVYAREPEFFCVENVTCPPDSHNLFQQGVEDNDESLIRLANLLHVPGRGISKGSVGYTVTHGLERSSELGTSPSGQWF